MKTKRIIWLLAILVSILLKSCINSSAGENIANVLTEEGFNYKLEKINNDIQKITVYPDDIILYVGYVKHSNLLIQYVSDNVSMTVAGFKYNGLFVAINNKELDKDDFTNINRALRKHFPDN